jgi:ribosomal protein L37AE/L43A
MMPAVAGEYVATVTITDTEGNVRAVRSASFLVRPRHHHHCPRCGWEELAQDAGRAVWRCLSPLCDWAGAL